MMVGNDPSNDAGLANGLADLDSHIAQCAAGAAESVRAAARILAVERARCRRLGADLFANMAWSIMLVLRVFEQGIARRALVAQLGGSPRLVERWIGILEGRGLVCEAEDAGHDAIRLTRPGCDQLDEVLASYRETGGAA